MTSPQIDRLTGLSSAAAIKAPVKAATTVNISLSGEQTVDTIALVSGDRVLVKNQSTGAQNGIYIVSTGNWSRAPDFTTNEEVAQGTQVRVNRGTNAGAFVLSTADPIVVGTTALTFVTDGSVSGLLQIANNLSDVASAVQSRVNLDTTFDFAGLDTVGGTADLITITTARGLTLTEGDVVSFQATGDNTTAAQVNVDGQGLKAIRRNGDTDTQAGDIVEDGIYIIRYDTSANSAAGAWILLYHDPAAVVTPAPPQGHIYGLTLSNGTDATNDIDIAVGDAASDDTTPVLMTLSSAITKRLDAAWAVGTGNGGLDTGSIANTTYHVWLIRRSDTGVVDGLFSASASSPTMPTNYDQKRRIGSIVRAGGAILSFSQLGNSFLWTDAILDITANTMGASAVTRTITAPAGVQVDAILTTGVAVNAGLDGRGLISSLDEGDTAPGNTSNVGMLNNTGSDMQLFGGLTIRTNTSAQLRTHFTVGPTGVTLLVSTRGYYDTRGQDS